MKNEIATLAGGCFWCMEAVFDQLKGVESVVSGYSGGHQENPTYKEVCSESTGHAEAVQINYDSDVISYSELLMIYFSVHDPTTLNRQGNDIGTSYRSAIFYHDDIQLAAARRVIQEISARKIWPQPVVTEITKYDKFYPAEDYHQNYLKKNPFGYTCHHARSEWQF